MKTETQITLESPEVQEWVDVGTPFFHRQSRDGSCFYVAVDYGTDRHGNHELRLLRFFTLGGQIECSCDVNAQSERDFTTLCLEKLT